MQREARGFRVIAKVNLRVDFVKVGVKRRINAIDLSTRIVRAVS